MALLCSMLGHVPGTARHRDRGVELAACHHCGCNLVRSRDGEWAPLRGLFVVPDSRNAGSSRARSTHDGEAHGRPLTGTAALFGALARISRLVEHDAEEEPRAAGKIHVIRLPDLHDNRP